MNLSTCEDIDAPMGTVFEAVADFEALKQRFARRGIEIVRSSGQARDVPGATWKASFPWHGRPLSLEAELVAIEPGQGYAIESRLSGVLGMTVVDLLALTDHRTRLFVSLDLKPTTLASRLLLSSLRLAKGTLARKLRTQVEDFAADVQARSSR